MIPFVFLVGLGGSWGARHMGSQFPDQGPAVQVQCLSPLDNQGRPLLSTGIRQAQG